MKQLGLPKGRNTHLNYLPTPPPWPDLLSYSGSNYINFNEQIGYSERNIYRKTWSRGEVFSIGTLGEKTVSTPLKYLDRYALVG